MAKFEPNGYYRFISVGDGMQKIVWARTNSLAGLRNITARFTGAKDFQDCKELFVIEESTARWIEIGEFKKLLEKEDN